MRYIFEHEMATELYDVTTHNTDETIDDGKRRAWHFTVECLVWFRNKHRDDQRPRSPTKEMASQASRPVFGPPVSNLGL